MMDKVDNYTQLRWCPMDGTVCGEDCDCCETNGKEVNSKDGYSEEE
jgi:hypothetical protein